MKAFRGEILSVPDVPAVAGPEAIRHYEDGLLVVEDGLVLACGPQAELGERFGDTPTERLNGLIVPGFVQTHAHLCQALFRGLAEEADLLDWLRGKIWPLEAAHTEASLAASARLGACELIAGGVTCVNDMGTVHHPDALGSTLEASGLPPVFGPAPQYPGESVPARAPGGAGPGRHRPDRMGRAAAGRQCRAIGLRLRLYRFRKPLRCPGILRRDRRPALRSF